MRLTTCCPNCGHTGAVEDRYPWIYGITGQQREIIMILIEKPGRWVTSGRILELLYALNPDGEPDNADGNLKTQIHRIRSRLGNVIEGRRTWGYRVHVDNEGNLLTMDEVNKRKAA